MSHLSRHLPDSNHDQPFRVVLGSYRLPGLVLVVGYEEPKMVGHPKIGLPPARSGPPGNVDESVDRRPHT